MIVAGGDVEGGVGAQHHGRWRSAGNSNGTDSAIGSEDDTAADGGGGSSSDEAPVQVSSTLSVVPVVGNAVELSDEQLSGLYDALEATDATTTASAIRAVM